MSTSEKLAIFKSKLATATDRDEVEIICEAENAELRARLENLNSLNNAFNKYRKICKEIFESNEDLQNAALAILKLTKAEMDERNGQSAKQVTQKIKDSEELLLDSQALIERAEKLLESSAYSNVAIGIALLTGRRMIEVLRTGVFYPADQYDQAAIAAEDHFEPVAQLSDFWEEMVNVKALKTSNYLWFYGQAKQKGSQREGIRKQPYAIPVLTDPEKILAAVAKLREMKPEFTEMQAQDGVSANDRVNDIADNNVKKAMRRDTGFAGLIPKEDLNPKDLRSAYAAIAYAKAYSPNISTKRGQYTALVLGHSEDDLSTCNSYFSFNVK